MDRSGLDFIALVPTIETHFCHYYDNYSNYNYHPILTSTLCVFLLSYYLKYTMCTSKLVGDRADINAV